jgi:hypothetical protein
VPLAITHGRRRRDLALHVRLRSQNSQTGFLNGVLAVSASRRAVADDRHTGLQHDPADHRDDLDVDGLRDGHPVCALKGISPELLEAARVDGATEWRVFRYITFPLLLPTIAVVSTTIIITALKAFDIVYTMTNGAFGTDNIALLMYKTLNNGDFGRSSAVAVVLLLAIVPIMALNVNRFRAQEAVR